MKNKELFKELFAEMFKDMPNTCTPNCGITFSWSRKGIGFGQFYLYVKNNQLYIDNEMMDKKFIKEVFCDMIDEAKLTDL